MAGGPAETMIGVGAVGASVVLLLAAVKNVSPLALVKQAVTEGKLDLEGLPPIVQADSGSRDPANPADDPPGSGLIPSKTIPADIQSIINKIRSEAIRKGVSRGQTIATDLEGALPILADDAIAARLKSEVIDAVALGLITAAEGITLNQFITARRNGTR